MKRNGLKMVVALMLVMAMMVAVFCASAEGTGLELVAEEAARSTVKGLTIEGETAVPSEVEVLIGEPSRDGVEDAPTGDESNAGDFVIDENGVLVKYRGEGGAVVIPDGVTAIGKEAFHRCFDVTSVTIPRGVTSIGADAFYMCNKMTSVTMPDGLTTIDKEAFNRCGKLTGVTIPDSVTSIGDGAFYDCGGLTIVTIPDSVTSIGAEAFYYCDSMTMLAIPDSVTSIGDSAFKFCDKLTIYGRKGSVAEEYARINNIPFVELGDEGMPVEMSECTITVEDQVYTGKKLTPRVTVKYINQTLKEGTDYTVTYKHNKAIGTATAIVKGKGGFTGTAKVSFRINPKKVSGLKLAAGKGEINAKWKKAPGGVTGYQLEYGLKKDFSGAKKVTVKKANAVQRTLSGLKSGKTYYVRIRAYKKVDKKTFYSAWSSAKQAKVK